MIAPLKEAAYFARTHIQPLLLIALLLELPTWLLDYVAPGFALIEEAEMPLGLLLVLMLLSVVQFAAALLYIHQQVMDQPVSALQAIQMAAARIGPLLLINILMTLAIMLGLMLLILPGLFIAYKLMFGECYLLFHGKRPLEALRHSYRINQGMANQLLPPLLLWGALAIAASVGVQLNVQADTPDWVLVILFEVAGVGLSIWGWALFYRLYQRHIVPLEPAPSNALTNPPPTAPREEEES